MTYEEVIKYPIDKKIKIGGHIQKETGYCSNVNDQKLIKLKRNWITIIFYPASKGSNAISYYEGFYERDTFISIQGYIYDGTEWYLAEYTDDGWQIIDENKIPKEVMLNE